MEEKNIYIRVRDKNRNLHRTEIRLSDDDAKASESHKNSETQPIDQQVLEQVFMQNEIIDGFSEPLKQAHDSVRLDIVTKMLAIMDCSSNVPGMDEHEPDQE